MTKAPRVCLAHILERAERIDASRDLPLVRAAILAILTPLDQLERELAGDVDGHPRG